MTLQQLLKMCMGLIALAQMPPEDRDEAKAKRLIADAEKALESDELKNAPALGDLAEMASSLKTVKDAVDRELKAAGQARTMGLEVRGASIVLPGGREERLAMLRDGRCFADDRVAMEFGAMQAVRFARSSKIPWGPADLAGSVRSMGERIEKDLAEQARQAEERRRAYNAGETRADADIDPGASGSGAELLTGNVYMREIIRNLEAYGTLYTECRRVPLSTLGASNWPKRTGGLTAYPTAVAAQITQSGMTFGTVQLTPIKWATLTGVPGEMFRDPSMLVELGNLIGMEIVYALAYAFDNAVANGDGTSTYGGITGLLQSATLSSQASAATHTTLSLLDGDDMDDFVSALSGSQYHRGAKFFGHLSVLMKLAGLKDSNGGYLYRQPNARVADGVVVNGYPSVMAQAMTAAASVSAGVKFAAFGDLKLAMYFGMLHSILIDTSRDVWFDQDMVAFRGLASVDAAEADSDAVILLKTAAE